MFKVLEKELKKFSLESYGFFDIKDKIIYVLEILFT
jgi:hypothetical protein